MYFYKIVKNRSLIFREKINIVLYKKPEKLIASSIIITSIQTGKPIYKEIKYHNLLTMNEKRKIINKTNDIYDNLLKK